MTLGPLEFIVIGFQGNHFTGEIFPQLRAVCEKGIIKVIDMLFVTKDSTGSIKTVEVSDLGEEEANEYTAIVGDLSGLLTVEDVQMLADAIPLSSSAAIILLEHTWAIGVKEAVIKAGAKLLADGIVQPAVQDMVEAEMAAAQKMNA